MSRFKTIGVCAVAALSFAFSSVAHADTTVITGKVIFKGNPADYKRSKIKTDKDPNCKKGKKTIGSYAVIINKKTDPPTLRNVLVSIKDGLGDRAFPVVTKTVTLMQKGCEYTPHVLGIQEGAELQVLNGDETNHNIHFLPKVNTEHNFTQPKKDTTTGKKLKLQAEDVFKVKCDVHPWMGCHIGVFKHPFFDVTSKTGNFTLTGMGPGTYTIEAWHETFGSMTAKVTVEAGATATHDFVFEPKK